MTTRLKFACLIALFVLAVAPVSSQEPPAIAFGTAGECLGVASPESPTATPEPEVGDFLPNVRVDDGLNPEHREPAVARAPDGALYCVYVERATHYNPELVMFTRSDDGGATWLAPAVRINDTAPNATFMPAIGLLGDGTIVVAWGEMKFGPDYNDEIRFSRSSDRGLTWTPSVVVHPEQPATDYLRPSLLVVANRILISYWAEVAYPNARPTVVGSEDAGDHWSAPVTVTMMTGPYDGAAPCLAYNDVRGTVGLAMPTSTEAIYFFMSADLGATWYGGVQVNDASASSVDYPDLACHGGYDYVVWGDNRAGQYNVDIYISRSANGLTFDTDVRVSDYVTGNQYEPHIAIDPSGGIHVDYIWNLPFQMNIDLYYTASTDGGGTWLRPCPRVNDVPYVVQPYVAWTSDLVADASGGAYIFWNDGRATGYYDHVYFSRDVDPTAVDDARTDGAGLAGVGRWQVLGQPGPAPRLRLELETAVPQVRLEWIDASGRRIGAATAGPLSVGPHELALRALEGNRRIAPGTYFLRLSAGARGSARRVVVVD
jgi:hypothetical protein